MVEGVARKVCQHHWLLWLVLRLVDLFEINLIALTKSDPAISSAVSTADRLRISTEVVLHRVALTSLLGDVNQRPFGRRCGGRSPRYQ